MRTGFVSHPGSGRVRDVPAPDSERELKSLKISLKVPPSAPPKPLYLRELEMEAGVGIALRNPLFRHKIARSSGESSRIRSYPF
jgi:hypothetical protein